MFNRSEAGNAVSFLLVFSELEARQSAIRDIKAFVRTKISGESLNQSFPADLARQGGMRPYEWTLIIYFVRYLGVLIYEGGKTLMYDPRENRIVYGEDVWESMRRNFGYLHRLRGIYQCVFRRNTTPFPFADESAAKWNSRPNRLPS